MKSTAAFSLLVFAYATTTLAIPTPPPVPALSDAISVQDAHLSASPDLVHNDHQVHTETAAEVLGKRMMYGPKKFLLGLNGVKREATEDDHVDTEDNADDLKKRMMYGPKKFLLGLNGV